MCSQELPAERVWASIRRAGAPLVESVTFSKLYEGPPIPEGFRSLTYTVTYRAEDHTLTSGEVAGVHDKIIQQVERQTGAKLRE